MTYAAQVRSVTKLVSSQEVDDFYDVNSLRIICKYFIGSIVTVKTSDEIIEGVLVTIYNNKICMTMVTVAKLSKAEQIIEVAKNKLLCLDDVLFISTKGFEMAEVTVKGKYIKMDGDAVGERNKKVNHTKKIENVQKAIINSSNNSINKFGKLNKKNSLISNNSVVVQHCTEENHNKQSNGNKNAEQRVSKKTDLQVASNGNEQRVRQSLPSEQSLTSPEQTLVSTQLQSQSSTTITTEGKLENEDVKDKIEMAAPKKTFTFNPNAPEFKPRSTTNTTTLIAQSKNSDTVSSAHYLYSPRHPGQPSFSSPVFPASSAPAIFVPNIFFFSAAGPPAHPSNANDDNTISGDHTNDIVSVSSTGNSNNCMMMMDDCYSNNQTLPSTDRLSPNSNHRSGTNNDLIGVVSDESIATPPATEMFVPTVAVSHHRSTPMPFAAAAPMLPIFPPPLPIFVPNQQSIKFSTAPLPFSSGNHHMIHQHSNVTNHIIDATQMDAPMNIMDEDREYEDYEHQRQYNLHHHQHRGTSVTDRKVQNNAVSEKHDIATELSNPLNWPPLPQHNIIVSTTGTTVSVVCSSSSSVSGVNNKNGK